MTTIDRDRWLEAIGVTAMWVAFIAYVGPEPRPHGNLAVAIGLMVLVTIVWSLVTNIAVDRRLPSLRRSSQPQPQDWRARGIGFVVGFVSLFPIGILIGFESWLVWCGACHVASVVEVLLRRRQSAVVASSQPDR